MKVKSFEIYPPCAFVITDDFGVHVTIYYSLDLATFKVLKKNCEKTLFFKVARKKGTANQIVSYASIKWKNLETSPEKFAWEVFTKTSDSIDNLRLAYAVEIEQERISLRKGRRYV